MTNVERNTFIIIIIINMVYKYSIKNSLLYTYEL